MLPAFQVLFPPPYQFLENRYRKVNYRYRHLIRTRSFRRNWKNYVKDIPDYPDCYEGKGVVICGGGPVYFTCAWININMLRESGCTLPIELWHLDNEMTDDLIRMIETLGVTCKNISEHGGGHLENYALKPFSILHSGFSEVLFLDADNISLRDPSYLFEHEAYLKTGAVFWPDFWIMQKKNPIWKILELEPREIVEQESGQLLINKQTCWRELQLCLHFNIESRYYYQILHGDKDTFQLAWLALKQPYHMMGTPVGFCGYEDPMHEQFFSTSMVQFDYDGTILFLHRNLLKWFYTSPNSKVWEQIITYQPNAKDRRVINPVYDGKMYVNLAGDIDKTPVSPAIIALEEKCLHFLKNLRSTKEFLVFLHVHGLRNQNRS